MERACAIMSFRTAAQEGYSSELKLEDCGGSGQINDCINKEKIVLIVGVCVCVCVFVCVCFLQKKTLISLL